MHGGTLSYPQPTIRSGEHRKLDQWVWGGAPETLFGHFVRNSVRFYVCFSALWKLDVRDNNTKSTRNITAVGKVTLCVWSFNWGAAAAKALNKWDGGRARRGEV